MENNFENKITVTGTATITNEYALYGKNFVEFRVKSYRLSGTPDTIPVVCLKERMPESLIEDMTLPGVTTKRGYVRVTGQVRTRNEYTATEGRTKLIIYVYADTVELEEQNTQDTNELTIEGVICKTPVHRITPTHKNITDLLIAVNNNSRSYYIPCISFNNTAKNVAQLNVGDKIKLSGRFQSRTYQKNSDTGTEFKVAFEICMYKYEKVNSDGNVDSDIDLFDLPM